MTLNPYIPKLQHSLFLSTLLAVCCGQLAATDASLDLFYSQYAFNGVNPAVGKVHLDYNSSLDSIALSGNATIISSTTDPGFAGAAGMLLDSGNGNLLVAGGGGGGFAATIYQITLAGSEGNPFAV